MNTAPKPRFFYGYIIVIAAFVMMAMSWGSLYTFGVFFNALLEEFHWSRGITSAAFSLNSLMYGVFSIISGRLTDKLGPRLVGTIFGILAGAGLLLMSLTNSPWQLFLFFGIVFGVGMGGFWSPPLSPVTRWFTARRGMMSGIVTAGIGAGTLAIVPLIRRSIDVLSWRWSYVIMGATVLVLTVLASQFLRLDPRPMGFKPYGEGMAEAKQSRRGADLSFGETVRHRQFWMLAGIFFCYGFYWNTIAVHVVPYATGMSISAVGAANILAIAGGVGIAGRLTVGSASDRMGSRSSIVLAISLMTIGMIWLLFSRQAWMFYLFAAVFGLGYGSLSALQAAATAELFGLSAVGILLGCFSFSFTIGGAIGPVLSGYLFDAASSYTPAFIICIIFSVTGLTLALLLRPVEKESEHDTARSS